MIRFIIRKFNISIFDRVVEVSFHRDTELKDVDLTVFRELETVSKPMQPVAFALVNPNQSEFAQSVEEEMTRQASLQAESELSHSFSKCQIANVDRENMNWRAQVEPGVFTCKCVEPSSQE